MPDLTLDEYRRYPPQEMRRKIREDAEKAFGPRDISPKIKRTGFFSKMVTALKTKLPFFRLKKSR